MPLNSYPASRSFAGFRTGAATSRPGGQDRSAETLETLEGRAGAWRAVLGPAESAAYVILVVNAAKKGSRAAPDMTGWRVAVSRVVPVAGALVAATFVAIVFTGAAELRPPEAALPGVDIAQPGQRPQARIRTGTDTSAPRRMAPTR